MGSTVRPSLGFEKIRLTRTPSRRPPNATAFPGRETDNKKPGVHSEIKRVIDQASDSIRYRGSFFQELNSMRSDEHPLEALPAMGFTDRIF